MVIILARGSQSYSGVTPTSQGGFGVTEIGLSASQLPSCILGFIIIKKFLLFEKL
jgi:hypothetical protein